MEKEPTYYELLVTRYLSGEATPGEITELSSLAGQNPENEKILREMSEAWMGFERTLINDSVNIEAEWEIFDKKLAQHDGSRESTAPVTHHSSLFARDSEDENVVTRTRRVIPIYHLLLRIAAVLAVLAIPLFFVFHYLGRPGLTEISANTGRVDAVLPDGSKVTLNNGALLQYPDHLKGKNRSVILKGEAYFDVAHNASKPFIISSGEIRVEVKGTSFYINTQSISGDFELVLTTGKVELYFENQPGSPEILAPGQKAVIHDHIISILPNSDPNYMAWKTRKIAFNNVTLNDVVATLSKVYQADIRLNNPLLAQCRLTASFDNQSLGSVLNVLKATLDIDIRNSGTLVEISGKECR
jgi:ferric-dicitrate binding protein FerR (iron transport regulator)